MTTKQQIISKNLYWRRQPDSNWCKRFCRPLPKPLDHVAETFQNWCPRPESNRHDIKSTDFESVASTNFTTRANLNYSIIIIYFFNFVNIIFQIFYEIMYRYKIFKIYKKTRINKQKMKLKELSELEI